MARSLDESKKVYVQAGEVLVQSSKALARELADPKDSKKLDRNKFEKSQSDIFPLARLLAEQAAAQAMLRYAEANQDSDGLETGLASVYVAQWVTHLNDYLFGREKRFGLAETSLAGCKDFTRDVLHATHDAVLTQLMFARSQDHGGRYGLAAEHEGLRDAFSRFARERIAPLAEKIHCEDELIPEDLLQGLAELGVFGISIPQEYGGNFMDHRSMIIATEELSIASLGAGGSVITRPEICAKAILSGGSEAQKKKWLPEIASGKHMVCVAVTEPNAGSDVANVQVMAKKTTGGYLINGEKTWCTFAGRANLIILLARTGDSGYKGLTLFLVEKPPRTSQEPQEEKNSQYAFEVQQEKGGKMTGHAIPTIGYRGMHSFAVSFEDYFVPEANRIGEEGEGFILQMKGFAGGRIQTAARALGVMEAAFRQALRYTKERQVFGKSLSNLPLSQQKLVHMAARVQAGRQLTYQIGDLMDQHQGEKEASLVKLLTCGDAEFVTREAMQLHGGMGYSEEYAVSRYFLDARVLSIFEGAEEVLALLVIARQVFTDLLKEGIK